VCVSRLPGSVNVPFSVTGVPSATVRSEPADTVCGGRFETVTVTLAVVAPPSSSVIVAVTV
jgi:hypothetical protein